MAELMNFSDLLLMNDLLREARECRLQVAVLHEGWRQEICYSRLKYLEEQYMILWRAAREANSSISLRQLCALILYEKNYR